MSNLSAFLNPVSLYEEKEVVVSKRFQDEDGKPVPFKIRSLTEDENDACQKKARRTRKVNGRLEEYQDQLLYMRSLVVEATVFPDFHEEQLCKKYGTLTPEEVPGKMLLIGEYSALVSAIMELSGIEMNTVEEEAKN
ncbi:MAG: phage tail assembly chaperone [Acutalibacter sp.]